jgi:2-polyprenyl-6-methoxyphenol hydroxylase-like FAD-dependent oxidoreductase
MGHEANLWAFSMGSPVTRYSANQRCCHAHPIAAIPVSSPRPSVLLHTAPNQRPEERELDQFGTLGDLERWERFVDHHLRFHMTATDFNICNIFKRRKTTNHLEDLHPL